MQFSDIEKRVVDFQIACHLAVDQTSCPGRGTSDLNQAIHRKESPSKVPTL